MGIYRCGFIESLQQLDLDPTDAREYFVKEQNKRWTIAACRAALDLRPNYAEAWNNICASYNKLGRYEEAAAACEQALRYKSDFELAHNNLQYARKMEKAPVR
jgi:Flp pilus assembly protein TadD